MRKFELPAPPSVWPLVGVLLTLAAGPFLLEGLFSRGDSSSTAVALVALPGWVGLVAVLVDALHAWRRPGRRPAFVQVEPDGVLVGDRFVAYAEIGSVEHSCDRRVLPGADGDVAAAERAWYEWSVSIRLGGPRQSGVVLRGETLEIVTKRSPGECDDPLGADLACAIDEGLAASRESLHGVEPALPRPQRVA
jgi:hypothetical protein